MRMVLLINAYLLMPGNPDLIDLDELVKLGWLQLSDICEECQGTPAFNKSCLVAKAYRGFLERAERRDWDDFAHFCQEKAFWLDDFALFIALETYFNQQC